MAARYFAKRNSPRSEVLPDAQLKALEQCRHTLAMELNFPLAHIYLGQVYLCVERFDDAIAEFEQLLAPDGNKPAWCLGLSGTPVVCPEDGHERGNCSAQLRTFRESLTSHRTI